MKVHYSESVAESCLYNVTNYAHLRGFAAVYDAIRKEMEECQNKLREADYLCERLARRIDSIESERARLEARINSSEEPSESDKSALNSLPSTGAMRRALSNLQREKGAFISYVQGLSSLSSKVQAVEREAKDESDKVRDSIKSVMRIMDGYFKERL